MENPFSFNKIIKIAQASLLSTVLFWLLNCLNSLICIYISCLPLSLYASLLIFGFIFILISIYLKNLYFLKLALFSTIYLIFFLFIIPLFIPNVSCVTGEELNLFKENLLISIILLVLYLVLFLLSFKIYKKYCSKLLLQLVPIIIGLTFYFLINYNSPFNFISIYDYILYTLIYE